MKLRNPLAAAAEWAERMSNPEETLRRKQQELQQRREREAEQPPIPEENQTPAAAAAPSPAPAPVQRPGPGADELRSAIWAGCIMLAVACSIVAFFIGMIR